MITAIRQRVAALDRASRWILAFVVLGLALRIAWVVYVGRTPPGFNDPVEYLSIGESIARGHGYINLEGFASAYYPIGYPAFVAVLAWLVIHTPLPDHIAVSVEAVQALLGAATIWAMAVVARRLAGAGAAVATAGLLALWPNLIFHAGVLLGETLFSFLVAGALLALLDKSTPWHPRTRRLLVAGTLFGLASLVRPIALLAFPVLLVALLVTRAPARRALAVTAIALLPTVAVVLPWTIRNEVRMHAFVPIATNTGDDLCIGRYPGATGWFSDTPVCLGPVAGVAPEHQEVARDSRNRSLAWHWVAADPLREARLVGWRFFYTFGNDHDGLWAADAYGQAPQLTSGFTNVAARVADDWFFAALGLAVLGAAAVVRSDRGRGLFVVVLGVAFALIPLAFFGDARFHVPAVPLLAVPAGVALARAPAVLRDLRTAPPLPTVEVDTT
jgi:hypothetical protein